MMDASDCDHNNPSQAELLARGLKGFRKRDHGPTVVVPVYCWATDTNPGAWWRRVGKVRPKHGRELRNDLLAKALQKSTNFSATTLHKFGADNIKHDDYIKVLVREDGTEREVFFKSDPSKYQKRIACIFAVMIVDRILHASFCATNLQCGHWAKGFFFCTSVHHVHHTHVLTQRLRVAGLCDDTALCGRFYTLPAHLRKVSYSLAPPLPPPLPPSPIHPSTLHKHISLWRMGSGCICTL